MNTIISDILEKQRQHAEAFLMNTEKREKIILYPYDLRQMVREQLRLIAGIRYLLLIRSIDTHETKELGKKLLGVEVEP